MPEKIAYQGIPGAYHEVACYQYNPELEGVGFETFDEKKFDNFLTNGMQALNQYRLELLEDRETPSNIVQQSNLVSGFSTNTSEMYVDLAERIEASFRLATEIFGPDRYKKELSGRVINKSLFEMITSTFLLLTDVQRFELLALKDEVKNKNTIARTLIILCLLIMTIFIQIFKAS